MDILRITARWSGFMGAPGYSAFHFAGGGGLIGDQNQVAERVAAAFSELTTVLPTAVSIDIEPEAEVIDSDTGVISDFRALDPIETVRGVSTGGYSASSGGVVNWRTSDVRFGRRIRGRTFIVPLSGNSYEANGTLAAFAISALNDFADTMMATDFDSEFGVWSRPRNGAGGVFATVDSANVPDMAAVLRSRRD